MRLLDNVSSQMTTLHKVLLDDLFTLATSEYTEVCFHSNHILTCVSMTTRRLFTVKVEKLQEVLSIDFVLVIKYWQNLLFRL